MPVSSPAELDQPLPTLGDYVKRHEAVFEAAKAILERAASGTSCASPGATQHARIAVNGPQRAAPEQTQPNGRLYEQWQPADVASLSADFVPRPIPIASNASASARRKRAAQQTDAQKKGAGTGTGSGSVQHPAASAGSSASGSGAKRPVVNGSSNPQAGAATRVGATGTPSDEKPVASVSLAAFVGSAGATSTSSSNGPAGSAGSAPVPAASKQQRDGKQPLPVPAPASTTASAATGSSASGNTSASASADGGGLTSAEVDQLVRIIMAEFEAALPSVDELLGLPPVGLESHWQTTR